MKVVVDLVSWTPNDKTFEQMVTTKTGFKTRMALLKKFAKNVEEVSFWAELERMQNISFRFATGGCVWETVTADVDFDKLKSLLEKGKVRLKKEDVSWYKGYRTGKAVALVTDGKSGEEIELMTFWEGEEGCEEVGNLVK
jgi:hypothetical protein